MTLGVTDLKKGRIIDLDDEPFKVVEYAQKVMGRGGSIVNIKIKSLIDGKVLDKTFKGNETVDSAEISHKKVQLLYSDDIKHYFMDESTYEQFEVNTDIISDKVGYIKDGDSVTAQLFNGQLIALDLPKNVPLKVTYTEDAVKGDTTSSIQKDATLETGIDVKVPAFIKKGDIVSIDIESGQYRERVT